MSEDKFVQRHKKGVGILSIVVFVVFSALVCWFVGRPMLRFVEQPEIFRDWIDSKGMFGQLIFIGMVALQVVFAIIPGEPLEIGAGYAFGAFEGTVLCIIGGLLGSVIVFAFVRVFGVRVVELFFPIEKINNLKFLKNTKNFEVVAFMIFMIPGTPKDIMTYFLGLTKIKTSHFMLIASVARLPSIITSTVGGDALGMQNYVFAIVVFAVTLVVSCAGLLIYRFICKRNEKSIDK